MKKTMDEVHENIHHALNLDGDPEKVRSHYENWAKTYDEDVIENYYGVQLIVDLMHHHVSKSATLGSKSPGDLSIIDVGCGTGLISPPLNAYGYTQLDGVDLSAEMLAVASATGRYQNLFSDVNINNPLPDSMMGAYDVAICLGVFTPGHVDPTALHQLIAMTKLGGIALLSARTTYHDTTNYQAISDAVVSSGAARLLEQRMDAPYRDDGDAHYWIYENTE